MQALMLIWYGVISDVPRGGFMFGVFCISFLLLVHMIVSLYVAINTSACQFSGSDIGVSILTAFVWYSTAAGSPAAVDVPITVMIGGSIMDVFIAVWAIVLWMAMYYKQHGKRWGGNLTGVELVVICMWCVVPILPITVALLVLLKTGGKLFGELIDGIIGAMNE